MPDFLSRLDRFIEASKVTLVPWNPANQAIDPSHFNEFDDSDDSSNLRPFHYLKSLERSLPSYAEDFGLQWTELYDDYRKDRYKHFEQFSRLGINPDSLSGKNCLDVGCGLGRLSEICLGRANYVFGVDLSEAVLEAARLIRSKRFLPVQASADDMPLKDNSFDLVYCWGVLHHTENPSKTLSEMWRVLKPGGTLVIWVYGRNKFYLKRSLLAKYFSELDEYEMLHLSNALTNLSHTCQLTSMTFLRMIANDLCYSVKNTKEYTRHVLYDGLGPAFHYLLDSQWFQSESKSIQDLESLNVVETPYTVATFKKCS